MNSFDTKDIDKKIIEVKKYLKDLSSNYQDNFLNIENYIKKEVQEIKNLIHEKKQIIPEIFNGSDEKFICSIYSE